MQVAGYLALVVTKGEGVPVMDRLPRSSFLDHMTGRVFLSQFDACRDMKAREAEYRVVA